MDNGSEVKSIYQEVYDKIKDDILSRKYLENTYLIERKIAERLYVSRTPVRNALKRLEKEGFVVYIRNRGMKVISLDEQQVNDIFEVRKALEKIAAVNSCRYIEWNELERLKYNLEKQILAAEEQDWNAFIDQDIAFHTILWNVQNNKIIRSMMKEFRNGMKLIGIRILYGDTGRIETTLTEHKEIYYAILRNNPEEAGRCMEKHVQSVYEAACDYLAAVRKVKLIK